MSRVGDSETWCAQQMCQCFLCVDRVQHTYPLAFMGSTSTLRVLVLPCALCRSGLVGPHVFAMLRSLCTSLCKV